MRHVRFDALVIPSERPAVLRTDSSSVEIESCRYVAGEIYCGAEPRSPDAFAELARHGIQTIVSVDSITPNVADAKRHGLRYIHIPVGYGGVDRAASLALTRVGRDESVGRVFVHCHHGRHRGPTAAAIAAIASGSINNEQAISFLHAAGTGTEYAGLYRAVGEFTPPAADVALPELVEQANVRSLAEVMGTIDHLFDAVKQNPTRGNGLLLHEALREWSRQSATDDELNSEFRLLVQDAVLSSQQILATADAGQGSGEIWGQIATLEASCTACHRGFATDEADQRPWRRE